MYGTMFALPTTLHVVCAGEWLGNNEPVSVAVSGVCEDRRPQGQQSVRGDHVM